MWGILIASGAMILAYDIGMLIRNRLKPCDAAEQNCEGRTYCSKVKNDAPARCLPLPAAPAFVLIPPVEPFDCVVGNLQSPNHIQDDSAFRLELETRPNSIIKAAHAGEVFLYPESQELRIVHPDGYTTYYYPIQKSRAKTGDRVEAGTPLAVSTHELFFGVYYLNPSVSPDAHRDQALMGFSIPFRLKFGVKEILSLSLDCSHPSGVKILNH
jgi:hypothetical protein